MDPSAHPLAALEHSLPAYLDRHGRRGRAIHITIAVTAAAALALLPIIRVDVSVRAYGMIRPANEKYEIRAPAAGFVAHSTLIRGGFVGAGDTLVVLRPPVPRERTERLERSRSRSALLLADLEALTGALDLTELRSVVPVTERLRQEHHHLTREVGELESRLAGAREEFDRAAALAATGAIPAMDRRRAELTVHELSHAIELAIGRQLSAWYATADAARRDLEESSEALARLSLESFAHRVEVPLAGSLEEVATLAEGSFVEAGQPIAVVSPDGPLHAEVQVAAADVGLLRPGMRARVHVDAFEARDWGALEAEVADISRDAMMTEDGPAFRIRLTLASDTLRLPNGVAGVVRKGMTVRANLIVTRRSLLQLLRDRVAAWIDPAADRPHPVSRMRERADGA